MSAVEHADARERAYHAQRREELLDRLVARIKSIARKKGWRGVRGAELREALNEEMER